MGSEGPQLSDTEKLIATLKICKRVQDLHHKEIIHGDLKPENLKIDINGNQIESSVIDSGLSKQLEPGEKEVIASRQGTSFYMAPELQPKNFISRYLRRWSLEKVSFSFASDIYALGKIFEHDMKLPKEIWEGMLKRNPKERNTMDTVISQLITKLEHIEDPDIKKLAKEEKETQLIIKLDNMKRPIKKEQQRWLGYSFGSIGGLFKIQDVLNRMVRYHPLFILLSKYRATRQKMKELQTLLSEVNTDTKLSDDISFQIMKKIHEINELPLSEGMKKTIFQISEEYFRIIQSQMNLKGRVDDLITAEQKESELFDERNALDEAFSKHFNDLKQLLSDIIGYDEKIKNAIEMVLNNISEGEAEQMKRDPKDVDIQLLGNFLNLLKLQENIPPDKYSQIEVLVKDMMALQTQIKGINQNLRNTPPVLRLRQATKELNEYENLERTYGPKSQQIHSETITFATEPNIETKYTKNYGPLQKIELESIRDEIDKYNKAMDRWTGIPHFIKEITKKHHGEVLAYYRQKHTSPILGSARGYCGGISLTVGEFLLSNPNAKVADLKKNKEFFKSHDEVGADALPANIAIASKIKLTRDTHIFQTQAYYKKVTKGESTEIGIQRSLFEGLRISAMRFKSNDPDFPTSIVRKIQEKKREGESQVFQIIIWGEWNQGAKKVSSGHALTFAFRPDCVMFSDANGGVFSFKNTTDFENWFRAYFDRYYRDQSWLTLDKAYEVNELFKPQNFLEKIKNKIWKKP